jgi:copper oxidase (laccase) domain-containing protein
LAENYGSEPKDLVVAIGPCIADCCFEVGPEVAAQFSIVGSTIDLVVVNRDQLVNSGVPADSIDLSGLCTKCSAEEFHSYRRDKELAGRMVAAISIV